VGAVLNTEQGQEAGKVTHLVIPVFTVLDTPLHKIMGVVVRLMPLAKMV